TCCSASRSSVIRPRACRPETEPNIRSSRDAASRTAGRCRFRRPSFVVPESAGEWSPAASARIAPAAGGIPVTSSQLRATGPAAGSEEVERLVDPRAAATSAGELAAELEELGELVVSVLAGAEVGLEPFGILAALEPVEHLAHL